MYVHEPVTFATLWPRLCFQIPPQCRTSIARDDTRSDYAQIFVRAVQAYLKGVGHPRHPSLGDATGLTANEIDAYRNDPDLRSRLLFLAVLSKDLPAYGERWKITVSNPPALDIRC